MRDVACYGKKDLEKISIRFLLRKSVDKSS